MGNQRVPHADTSPGSWVTLLSGEQAPSGHSPTAAHLPAGAWHPERRGPVAADGVCDTRVAQGAAHTSTRAARVGTCTAARGQVCPCALPSVQAGAGSPVPLHQRASPPYRTRGGDPLARGAGRACLLPGTPTQGPQPRLRAGLGFQLCRLRDGHGHASGQTWAPQTVSTDRCPGL